MTSETATVAEPSHEGKALPLSARQRNRDVKGALSELRVRRAKRACGGAVLRSTGENVSLTPVQRRGGMGCMASAMRSVSPDMRQWNTASLASTRCT